MVSELQAASWCCCCLVKQCLHSVPKACHYIVLLTGYRYCMVILPRVWLGSACLLPKYTAQLSCLHVVLLVSTGRIEYYTVYDY